MKKVANCIAVFGTASNVGKSMTATALCRIFSNLNIKVAPFKSQNMSNNSFAAYDGREMGRAQAIQSFAARTTPTADMNPILLKPSSETCSQVIVRGMPYGSPASKNYFADTDFFFNEAKKSFDKLKKQFELIVIEGAGSCAEVNLKSRDFANFKMAKYANADVVLVADIDKGGVFAQIIGTIECIGEEEKQMVKGIIINKFRGKISLFRDGIEYIEQKTNIPIVGIIPYFKHIELDKEDSQPLDDMQNDTNPQKGMINIAVLKLPYISNFTDFEAFKMEENVAVHYLTKSRRLEGYHALIIPGSKSVSNDAKWVKASGWENAIKKYVSNKGYVAGICGGFQILGKTIYDPHMFESNELKTGGLGLLDLETTLTTEKTITNTEGIWLRGNIHVEGYEIHMGKTKIKNIDSAVKITKRNNIIKNDYDGAISKNGRIWGCYLHGIFDGYRFRHYFLRKISKGDLKNPNKENMNDFRERQINLLAEHFRKNMHLEKVLKIAGIS